MTFTEKCWYQSTQELDGSQRCCPVRLETTSAAAGPSNAGPKLLTCALMRSTQSATTSSLFSDLSVARPGRISDETSGSAHKRDRAMPVLLKSPKSEQRDEVPNVKARCGRIESAVEGQWATLEISCERGLIRRLSDQASPFEIVRSGLIGALSVGDTGTSCTSRAPKRA